MRYRTPLTVVMIAAVAVPIFAQSSDALRPSFEVASIKPNNTGDPRTMIRGGPGGRVSMVGVTTKQLLGNAYRLRDFQIIGGPDWIASDRFDIEARADAGADLQGGKVGLMMQSLLAERFELKTHTERREFPVYELVLTKNGSKLKPVPAPERPAPGAAPPPLPGPGGPLPPGAFRIGRGLMEGSAVPFANVVQSLSQLLGRMIVDKTGLTGNFDIKLTWTPDPGQELGGPFGPPPPGIQLPPPADPNGPSIFTAVQEQLGLRLESTKGPVEVLVIDSVQKPSEN